MAKNKKAKRGKKEKWIREAIKKPGAFTRYCKRKGFSGVTEACIRMGLRSKNPKTRARARLARTLRALSKRRKKK